MKNIRLEHITKSYRGEQIFENLSLTIAGGKFFALLGPSGSGKTTLLRLIAGFETVDQGTIYLGDDNITYTPINERRVNTVFQHYALFPHLNVFDNVAYGLRIKGIHEKIIDQKVRRMLSKVRLEKQIFKPIQELSGGQQQRVALARAIINEPEVLLLDEPLAALDLKLREQMLLELIDLQYELHTTFVYVTHDQLEALTVADHMAIMNSNGEIEQIGTPKEIYEFPVSSFVAQFVGTTNIFPGVIQSAHVIELQGLGKVEITKSSEKLWIQEGVDALMSIRPEKIVLSKEPLHGFSNALAGVVEGIVYHGKSTQYKVRLFNRSIMHVFKQNEEHVPREVFDYDEKVFVCWQKENVVLLEK